jgi:hypothetical protein
MSTLLFSSNILLGCNIIAQLIRFYGLAEGSLEVLPNPKVSEEALNPSCATKELLNKFFNSSITPLRFPCLFVEEACAILQQTIG